MQARPRPKDYSVPDISPGSEHVDPAISRLLSAKALTPADLTNDLDDRFDDRPLSVPLAALELDDLSLTITESKLEHLCELIQRGVPRSQASVMAGVPPKQLNQYLTEGRNEEASKDPMAECRRQALVKVRDAILEAQAVFEAKLIAPIMGAVVETNSVAAAQWMLEHAPSTKKAWGKSSAVEHKGKVAHTHKVANTPRLADLSKEEIEQMQAMLLRQEQAMQSDTNQKQLTVDAELVDM